jgi:hypothetical protein
MKARPFKQATTTAHPRMVHNEIVAEALAKQAARRPPKAPPKEMPATPKLPRVRKAHRGPRPAR